MAKLLLIEDNDALRLFLAEEFAQQGHVVESLDRADRADELLATGDFDVVVSDNRMPGTTGLELLAHLKAQALRVPVILMTGHADTETAIEATKRGAFDYVVKPLDFTELPAELLPLVAQAAEVGRLVRQPIVLPSETDSHNAVKPTVLTSRDPGKDSRAEPTPLLGNSRAMRQVCRLIGQVAPTDVPVLIRGETGTGKELVARAIFHHSPRAEGPLVAVNCAAIPETLLEGELFGHEKGAFTGADRTRVGRFEQANGGTLFLDEIGDMSPAVQAKLLRVLQERELTRLGSGRTVRVDVRVIAATHRDLEHAIRDGRFREDLFHRLNGVTIRLPPLRERLEDLPVLISHFVRHAARELNRDEPTLSAAAMTRLAEHSWPGNVRELANVLRRAVLLCRAGQVDADDFELTELRSPNRETGIESRSSVVEPQSTLPKPSRTPEQEIGSLATEMVRLSLSTPRTDLHRFLMEVLERELLRAALEESGGNKAAVAKRLGLARNTVISRIQEFKLDSPG